MAKKYIDVANLKEVRIGYQYELNIDTLVFTGIEFEGTIRMAYSHKDIINSPQFIPLKKTADGYELPIDGLFEELSGKYVCTIYGYDLNADGSIEKRKLYPQFILYKEPAQNVKKSKEAKHVPEVLKDIYESFVELIDDIKNKLESGFFNGEPGNDGEQGPPGPPGPEGKPGKDGTVSDEQMEEIVDKVTEKVPPYNDTEIKGQINALDGRVGELEKRPKEVVNLNASSDEAGNIYIGYNDDEILEFIESGVIVSFFGYVLTESDIDDYSYLVKRGSINFYFNVQEKVGDKYRIDLIEVEQPQGGYDDSELRNWIDELSYQGCIIVLNGDAQQIVSRGSAVIDLNAFNGIEKYLYIFNLISSGAVVTLGDNDVYGFGFLDGVELAVSGHYEDLKWVNDKYVWYLSQDGTFTREDRPQASSTDVQVNGTSITESGVANIPYASKSNYGVVKSTTGIDINSNGIITLQRPSNTDVNSRNFLIAVTLGQLDYSVKAAMCDGKGAEWTSQEKKSAQERIGIVTLSQEEYDLLEVKDQNVLYFTYQGD